MIITIFKLSWKIKYTETVMCNIPSSNILCYPEDKICYLLLCIRILFGCIFIILSPRSLCWRLVTPVAEPRKYALRRLSFKFINHSCHETNALYSVYNYDSVVIITENYRNLPKSIENLPKTKLPKTIPNTNPNQFYMISGEEFRVRS